SLLAAAAWNVSVAGLALEHVRAIPAEALVVALAEADDVVALLTVRRVPPGLRADDVVASRAVDVVIRRRSGDRALRLGAGRRAEHAVPNRGRGKQPERCDGDEDPSDLHGWPPVV